MGNLLFNQSINHVRLPVITTNITILVHRDIKKYLTRMKTTWVRGI